MNRMGLLLLLLIVSPLAFAGPADDEAAVWQLEQDYWEYVKANDLDSYRALWDQRFVGWPGFSPHPLGKENISDWIPPLHEDPERELDIELKQEAVRSFGDIVVAHYLFKFIYRHPRTGEMIDEGNWGRITHTWQRRGDTWEIVTGMSASYDHPE